jgi:hypothetical protein
MKLEELLQMAEEDSVINEAMLGKESMKISALHAKWLNFRTKESMLMKKYKMDWRRLYIERREYYLGRADSSVYKAEPLDVKILRGEVDKYLESDLKLQELTTKIEIQQEKVDFCADFLKGIMQRTFNIKNAIEFQKLLAGVV